MMCPVGAIASLKLQSEQGTFRMNRRKFVVSAAVTAAAMGSAGAWARQGEEEPSEVIVVYPPDRSGSGGTRHYHCDDIEDEVAGFSTRE